MQKSRALRFRYKTLLFRQTKSDSIFEAKPTPRDTKVQTGMAAFGTSSLAPVGGGRAQATSRGSDAFTIRPPRVCRGKAWWRSGAAGPPDRRSCKASASKTNDPERDAASKGADVGRSGNEVGRRPLLGLAALLGAGGVGVLGAEATPTVEEMLERTKENRLKNDAARYANGEAKFLAAQGRADTRTPEQLEDLMQRLAKGKEEEVPGPSAPALEPEPAAPEPVTVTEQPAAPVVEDPEPSEGKTDVQEEAMASAPEVDAPVSIQATQSYEETWAGRPAW